MPILANLFAALHEELKKKCVHDKNLKWPILFKRFIDDGFGIMEGTKKMSSIGYAKLMVYEKLSQSMNGLLVIM